jgi:amino acid adenylation domain-containing protein
MNRQAGPTVPWLFEAAAAAHPEATAVECAGRRLTYRELDRLADVLAGRLLAAGIGPGSVAGVCAERSVDLIVAMLGVLKAGGAYLPLDHRHPADRLAFMLEESAASLVLTQAHLAEPLARLGRPVVVLDEDPARSADAPPAGRATGPGPEDLAYILYTSGSTGRPKGVQVRHRNVANLMTNVLPAVPGLRREDVVLSVASCTFDMSVGDIFPTLGTGARLVLASDAQTRDPVALAELIEASGATVMHATPTTWQMLLDSGWTGSTGLVAVSGGDSLSERLAARLLDRCAALWNGYGPTETTVYTTFSRVEPGRPVTIGAPVPGARVHLLDEHLRPVPAGTPGEIVIAGAGVSAGYVGRADETQRRFLPDPVAPASVAYLTGDLGRLLADGSIAHLGRLDRQVKLHGMRIELGEIEEGLREHEAVKEAVVVLREDVPGHRRLVGYVAWRPGHPGTVANLRDHLGARLPDYMLPSAWVELPEIPLTTSGKLDRTALPAPELPQAQWASEQPASGTACELCQTFAEVLGIAEVGMEDDFYQIGGDSIRAVTLIAEIESRFGYRIKVSQLPDPLSAGAVLAILPPS